VSELLLEAVAYADADPPTSVSLIYTQLKNEILGYM
jgi:hypothetical protein